MDPAETQTPARGGRKEQGTIGAPGRIRTHDPLVRSQVLYPTELRALWRRKYSRISAIRRRPWGGRDYSARIQGLESCPSGRRGRPAKALYGLRRIEGSNPSLSATETNDLIRGRFCCQTKRPPLRRLILQPERFVQHAHRELHILLVHYDRNLDL